MCPNLTLPSPRAHVISQGQVVVFRGHITFALVVGHPLISQKEWRKLKKGVIASSF